MTIPIWITDTGSLGTIEENLYFEYQLEATGSNLKFKLQAGHLPYGLIVTENGLIRGTPYSVTDYILSTFVIRAYDELDPDVYLYDRTFSLSVQGPNLPFFITTDYLLVSEYSGNKISYQIEYADPDVNQSLTIRKVYGELPPGLVLDDTGKISGIVPLLPGYTGQLSEPYDLSGYDTRGYDLSAIDPGYNYKDFFFTLEISDGIYPVERDYAIRIKEPPINLSPTIIQDSGNIGTFRHDNYFEYRFLAYDVFNQGITWSLVTTTSYGYDVNVYDSDLYDSTAYEAYPFRIDPESGVLFGKIGILPVEEKTYSFIVRATRPNGAYTQNVYTVTFLGDKNKDLLWLTDSNLGNINIGDYSYFHINTYNSSNLPITYKYSTGNLPEGLSVMASGAIAGRIKFGAFTLDGKNTTFDNSNTSFDQIHKFTVRAYSANDYITETTTNTTYITQNFTADGIQTEFTLLVPTIIDDLVVTDNGVSKTAQNIKDSIVGDYKLSVNKITFFTPPIAGHSIVTSVATTTTTNNKIYLIDEIKEYSIRVLDPYNKEYTNIYIEALIKKSQRDKWNSILNNTKIFPVSSLYYPDDKTYALPKKASFLLLAGIENMTANDFLQKMNHNFYKKSVIIGDPKVSIAYDPATKEPIYEVIYLPVYDDLENSKGDSVGSSLDLSKFISYYVNGTTAYPNSYENMQNNINDITTIFSYVTRTTFTAFPLWMKPLYPNLLNGKNPREVYKRAIPIAYVKVGESNRILFNLKQKKIDFKQFSFEVQRLTIDNTVDDESTTLTHTEFDQHSALSPDSIPVYESNYVLDQNSPLRSSFTTFDSQGTRFINEGAIFDKGDPIYKYIRFPDTNILE